MTIRVRARRLRSIVKLRHGWKWADGELAALLIAETAFPAKSSVTPYWRYHKARGYKARDTSQGRTVANGKLGIVSCPT